MIYTLAISLKMDTASAPITLFKPVLHTLIIHTLAASLKIDIARLSPPLPRVSA